jgi:hypothetical protein
MVFLGETNLPSSVVLFVDILIGLHLLVVLFYFVKLATEVSIPKTRVLKRDE